MQKPCYTKRSIYQVVMAIDLLVSSPLLRPLIGLNLWTFIIEIWMAYARNVAIRRHDVKYTPHFTRNYLYSKIPPEAQWPGDNYNHLMEQPTQYYAVVLALVLLGDDSAVSVRLAWGYVGARMVHSIIHAKYNSILWRSRAFTVSTVFLLVLTLRAAKFVF